jgi:hypothetical protein
MATDREYKAGEVRHVERVLLANKVMFWLLYKICRLGIKIYRCEHCAITTPLDENAAINRERSEIDIG